MKNTSLLPSDALLCALVIAPNTYARNRFFDFFRNPRMARVRRRAAFLRGIIRQLVGHEGLRGELVCERVLDDGRVLFRLDLKELALSRTTALSPLEASLVRYAAARAGAGSPTAEDRQRIETAVVKLARELPRPHLDSPAG